MHRTIFVLFALILACHTGGGSSQNADEDAGNIGSGGSGAGCDVLEDGRYRVVYEKLDGSCGSTPFYNIPIEYQYSQTERWQFSEVQYEYTNKTEITYRGCALGVSHQVSKNDNLIFHLQGQIEIENEIRLAGRVFRIEYNDEQAVMCQGNYEVELRKIDERRI